MARDPELSIKVKVDPQIDEEHLGIDIQNQIDKLNKLPKVKIDPDTKNFGKDLSKQISQNLRAVNRVLKTQLDRMSTNINSLNQVSQELFSGTDFSSNIQSQAEIVSSSLKTIEDHISTLSNMFEASNSTKLKLSGSFSSIEELDNLIVAVKDNLLSLFNDGPLNDDNEFSKTFTAALPSIKKLRDIIFDIEEISDNKTVLTKLGIDGKSLVNSRNNLELLSSLLDTIIDYNDIGDISGIFDELKSTENISKYFSAALSSLKELDTALDNTSKKTTNIKKDTKIFDRSQLDEISNAYSEAIGNLISKQNAFNKSKEITINLEDQLLQKTTETTAKIGEQVQNLKSLFSEVASSDIGKQLPAVSEYMKSKAELEALKNIESAKSLSLNVNSSSAKEYEAALKGIKDRINELGKEGAFDGLNNNIDENERAFINAKEYIKDYASALDEVKSKGKDTRLPQQKTTGLNVSNIENYSQKVTTIKNDLYALKDTVFPAVYSDINRTYGHLFDDSIINAQSYIDKLNELPTAASSKAPAKTQHSKKVETIDSTNIKNYATLLNGIQGAMNDMKTTIVPGFDKVLSENGKKIADIGGSLVNYVAVLKRGLTAVNQSEKNMADKTAAKPSMVPTKSNAPVKKPTAQRTQAAKVTIDSNEVVITGDPVDIPGKVELKDKDIKRPDPLNINGAVKIKASDIKIDDVEISKKKFDINGNLILKNAEIVDAAKEAQKATDKKDSDDAAFFTKLQTAVNRKIKAYDGFIKAEPGTKDWVSKSGKNNIADNNLLDLQNQATATGLSSDQRYSSIMGQYRKDIDAINEAQQKRTKIEEDAIKVQDKDIISLQKFIKTVDAYKGSIEKDNKTDMPVHANVTNIRGSANDLLNRLQKDTSGDKDQVAIDQAKDNKIDGVKSLIDAYNKLGIAANKAGINVQGLRIDVERMNKTAKGKTEVANLKSQLMDYLEKFPKVSSAMGDSVRELQAALADPNAYQNIGKLKQQMAELRAQAKALGLESESLFDKFEKLFGQHLSTMITMAALHKMQDALRIVYQNVVEIDTAVTELRKVSEYAGKSLEEYMGRASEQAQKLGVSISDYINSTADWKRLGYSDEDAENMATYSTLLKNVGDGIDDVNTSSSYLISTLQGFGLLADQAEDVVNKIDAVANTQPVTAKDLGEILTRSSAAMSAANNTLEETIALGTAANAVIQDADTVGTTLKSLSMYLRAAKSDAENAGIEVDGMANSVSELRSELKSLTGVDIMLDSKNFKSTYQIMKELSQVWSSLSDVTQANVTEMIGGKRNANAVSAILNNFSVAESAMESAANSANVAWAENEKYLDSIQGRLNQLDASFQALSTDVLDSGLVKTVVSLATGLTKAADAMIKFTGAIPMGAGIATFITQLGKPKMTGFTIVPSNTPGGDTEQACCAYYIKCCSAREYLVKPTNMAA